MLEMTSSALREILREISHKTDIFENIWSWGHFMQSVSSRYRKHPRTHKNQLKPRKPYIHHIHMFNEAEDVKTNAWVHYVA